MSRSFQIAAADNIVIGVVAIVAALPTAGAAVEAAAASAARQQRAVVDTRSALVLWTFFVSGVMSLALEIVWFRMLVVFLRPTAYAFTIMLACVLAGIALGSALAAPLLRTRATGSASLAAVQGVIGLAAVLSFNLLTRTQAGIDAVTPWFERLGLHTYLAPIVVSSMIAMLPTTILLGMAFPIGLTALDRRCPTPTSAGGPATFYSLNVLGAILGSVIAGFVLLPEFGTRTSLIIVSALAIALERDAGADGTAHAIRCARWRSRSSRRSCS